MTQLKAYGEVRGSGEEEDWAPVWAMPEKGGGIGVKYQVGLGVRDSKKGTSSARGKKKGARIFQAGDRV